MGNAVVDVFLFTYRSMGSSSLIAINAMLRYSEQQGVSVRLRPYGNALIHRARNMALGALKPDATHALFVDDDMLPRPEALVELLAQDRPVISALCTTRQSPIVIAAKQYDEQTDNFAQIVHVNLKKTVSGQLAVGAAFLLIQRDAVERLGEYHLSAQDWVVENRRTHNRLKVRAENREAERVRIETLRRELFEREKLLRVFSLPISDLEREVGEDIAFGRKCLQLGIPVAIAGQTVVGHMGEHPYSVWDIIHQEQES